MSQQSKAYKEWYEENVKGKRGDCEFSHRFFSNKQCEFFPCHNDVAEEKFSCLFCYCPLMAQENCIGIQSGMGVYLANGYKDCSGCSIFHDKDNYDLLMDEIAAFYDELYNS